MPRPKREAMPTISSSRLRSRPAMRNVVIMFAAMRGTAPAFRDRVQNGRKVATLTDAGRGVLQEVRQARTDVIAPVLAALSPQDREVLVRANELLRQIAADAR